MEQREVYYFSGTGNSYIVAKSIAEKTGSTLVSIARTMQNNYLSSDAKIIGIVFPVYYVELPIIVDEFISTLSIKKNTYIYAVATYGGGKGGTLNRLQQALENKGVRLSTFYGIQMPQNAFKKPFDNYTKCYKNAEKMTNKICSNITIRKTGIYYTSRFINIIQALLYPMLKNIVIKEVPKKIDLDASSPIENVILNLDKLIEINDNCNGCAVCEKVCPVNNIELLNNKPLYKHSCQNCLACYNFCPQQAIAFSVVSDGHRYIHPNYSVKQAIDNNK